MSKRILKLRRSSIIVHLFFALLLVVAQGQLLVHQTDLEAHLDHTACEDLIHFSSVGSGILAEAGFSIPSSDSIKYSIPNYSNPAIAFYFALPQPRAPPVSSLS